MKPGIAVRVAVRVDPQAHPNGRFGRLEGPMIRRTRFSGMR